MMTDQEFSELLDRLYQLALEEGDLGYRYWDTVIHELKEMRGVFIRNAPKPPLGQRKSNAGGIAKTLGKMPDVGEDADFSRD